MDSLVATQLVQASAAEVVDRKTLVHDYIQHHVLYHVADGEPTVWNLPFVRVPVLDVFRNDGVMLATALLVIVGQVDDARDLNWKWRIGLQAAVALAMVFIADVGVRNMQDVLGLR